MADVLPAPVPEWVPALDGILPAPAADRAASLAAVLPGRAARAFAAACARRVLPVFEAVVEGDDRPRRQVGLAELYAFGRAELGDDDDRYDSANAAGDAALDIWNNVGRGAPYLDDPAEVADLIAGDEASVVALKAAADAASAAFSAIEPGPDDCAAAAAYAVDAIRGFTRSRPGAAVAEQVAQARLLWLAVPPPGPALGGSAAMLAAAWLEEWFRTGQDDRVCRAVLADALEEAGTPPDDPRLRGLRELAEWHPGL